MMSFPPACEGAPLYLGPQSCLLVGDLGKIKDRLKEGRVMQIPAPCPVTRHTGGTSRQSQGRELQLWPLWHYRGGKIKNLPVNGSQIYVSDLELASELQMCTFDP